MVSFLFCHVTADLSTKIHGSSLHVKFCNGIDCYRHVILKYFRDLLSMVGFMLLRCRNLYVLDSYCDYTDAFNIAVMSMT